MTSIDASPRHVLLLANRTCPCPGLHEFVLDQITARPAEITVVAPALNSRLAHWVSDTDKAAEAARERLELAVAGLQAEGISVSGLVGDAKPITALRDVLAITKVDMVVISTFPSDTSHWLEHGLLEAAQTLPVQVVHYMSKYGLAEAQALAEAQPQADLAA